MKSIKYMVPKSLDEIKNELIDEFKLSQVEAEAIINNNLLSLFMVLSKDFEQPTLLSRILLQIIPEFEKKRGKKLTQEEIKDILGVSINGRNVHSDAGIKSILGIANRKKWDRNTLELALSLYMLKNVPLSELEVRNELNPLNEEDIKRILNELKAEGGLTEKNVIVLFRKQTDRSFDPKVVIEIFREMKKADQV